MADDGGHEQFSRTVEDTISSPADDGTRTANDAAASCRSMTIGKSSAGSTTKSGGTRTATGAVDDDGGGDDEGTMESGTRMATAIDDGTRMAAGH